MEHEDVKPVVINDFRGQEADFTLDQQGFQLCRRPVQTQSLASDDEIKGLYYEEVEDLLKEVYVQFISSTSYRPLITTALGLTKSTSIITTSEMYPSKPVSLLRLWRIRSTYQAQSEACTSTTQQSPHAVLSEAASQTKPKNFSKHRSASSTCGVRCRLFAKIPWESSMLDQ